VRLAVELTMPMATIHSRDVITFAMSADDRIRPAAGTRRGQQGACPLTEASFAF
jgi:hypothetical protein